MSRLNALNKSIAIREFLEYWWVPCDPNESLASMEDLFTVLQPHWLEFLQLHYNKLYSSLIKVISEFHPIYRVNSDTDITIHNETFLPFYNQIYQIDFNIPRNASINIIITNNTFKNLYLRLINSEGTMIIDGNIFIGSGMTFTKEINDTSLLIIVNNTFQGIYFKPVVELGNVKNVSLKENNFENLQMITSLIYEGKHSMGIVCNSSRLNVHDCSFKNMTLDTIIQLDYCSVKMDNVRFWKIISILQQ